MADGDGFKAAANLPYFESSCLERQSIELADLAIIFDDENHLPSHLLIHPSATIVRRVITLALEEVDELVSRDWEKLLFSSCL